MERMTVIRSGVSSGVRASLVLAAFSANLGCNFSLIDDHCGGHGYDEDWCEQDQVMTCLQEDSYNHKKVLNRCMPGG